MTTTRTLEVVEDAHADVTLSQLESLVDKHFAAFQKFGRRTVEEAWQAGCYLNQAKELVAHGGWLDCCGPIRKTRCLRGERGAAVEGIGARGIAARIALPLAIW